jgi:thiamine-monophosphate kinase
VTEDEIVAAIREIVEPVSRSCHPERSRRIKLGIGDDAALWQPSRSERSAISSDILIEGIHFTRDAMTLMDAGWRAMAANLSDLAAMGARPVLATVALGVPASTGAEAVLELYRGLAACAQRSRISIAGGDLSRAERLTIAITVVGEVRASNVKTRAGGRPGDVVAVTGILGAARAGLELTRGAQPIDERLSVEALRAFRRPQARLAEGRFLAASRNVRAMMDCSDGLSTDLQRLCAASRCGGSLDTIPVADAARAVAAALGEDPERFALAGGEDFELLVAIRPRAFAHLASRYNARFGRDLVRVGVLRKGSGVTWNGAPLMRSGWDHFAN